jgi:hypothetical protein
LQVLLQWREQKSLGVHELAPPALHSLSPGSCSCTCCLLRCAD